MYHYMINVRTYISMYMLATHSIYYDFFYLLKKNHTLIYYPNGILHKYIFIIIRNYCIINFHRQP